MILVSLAVLSSAMSVASGIAVVGNGENFRFRKRDILQGRRDAWLYIWITFSTIFGLAHCAALLDYGLHYGWNYQHTEIAKWMPIHTGVGVLLTVAHLFLKGEMKRFGHEHIFLWGSKK